jgi:predicted N-acyltransferase
VALNVRVFHSIEDIPRPQWDAVWPLHTEGYDFYLCQQRSGIDGFEFQYIGLFDSDKLVLVAPVFTADFDMGLAMGDTLRRWLHLAQRVWPRFLVFRSLFCGSPTSEKGVVGIHAQLQGHPDLLKQFDQALLGLARQKRAWMMVLKDFLDTDLQSLAGLKHQGWFMADSLPTARLPISFSSLDGYLAQLGYGTRKNLRRKLRETEKAGGLKVEVTNQIAHCVDEIHRLYLQVHDHGPLQWEKLTSAFFLNACSHLPDNAVFFLYWSPATDSSQRKLVGFNYCLQFDDRLIDKYIGMDYAVSRKLNLYFISFLKNVEWCIANGKQAYMLSQGAVPSKSNWVPSCCLCGP